MIMISMVWLWCPALLLGVAEAAGSTVTCDATTKTGCWGQYDCQWCADSKVCLPGNDTCPTAAADPGGCTGKSRALYDWECEAWQEIFDATNGSYWNYCNDTRSDPCSCDGGEGDVCAWGLSQKDMRAGVCCEAVEEVGQGITRIVLHRANMTGELPSIGKLGSLQVFDVDHNDLYGKIPADLPARLEAFYVGGSTNRLEGPLPATLPSELAFFDVDGQSYGHSSLDKTIPDAWRTGLAKLIDLKLKYTGLTGVLPDLAFANMTGCGMKSCCDLTGNAFACPLPKGAAELCNATCL